MAGRIVVVGAALVDFVGDYSGDQRHLVTRTGTARISIGGSAFNIAADLAEHRQRVQFFTCCEAASVTGILIRNACVSIGLEGCFLRAPAGAPEPAYISLRHDHSIEASVASSPIEMALLFEGGALERALRSAALVVIETNLTTAQIRDLMAACVRLGKPVCCMIASDAKAERIFHQDFAGQFALVSMNAGEAALLGFDLHGDGDVRGFCRALGARQIIITDGPQGWVLLGEDGAREAMPAAVLPYVENALGAGDALFAAACVSVLNGEALDSAATRARMTAWTSQVLQRQEGHLASVSLATPDKSTDRRRLIVTIVLLCALCLMLGWIAGRM